MNRKNFAIALRGSHKLNVNEIANANAKLWSYRAQILLERAINPLLHNGSANA